MLLQTRLVTFASIEDTLKYALIRLLLNNFVSKMRAAEPGPGRPGNARTGGRHPGADRVPEGSVNGGEPRPPGPAAARDSYRDVVTAPVSRRGGPSRPAGTRSSSARRRCSSSRRSWAQAPSVAPHWLQRAMVASVKFPSSVKERDWHVPHAKAGIEEPP